MDKIDYKQIAKNCLRLIENGYTTKEIEIYLNWVFRKKLLWIWNYHARYLILCKILEFLEILLPSEEEWKKR